MGHSLHYKFHYTQFDGDGDSSAYTTVLQMNNRHIPSEDQKVLKEECINHVSSKCVAARLRKAKQEASTHKMNVALVLEETDTESK